MANNVAFALAAERLFGIEITERCKVLRVIACELSRIISHLVWLGTTCIDIGAFTPFLWSFQQREEIYKLLESGSARGSRPALTRVGGMGADIPDGFEAGLRDVHRSTFPKTLDEVDTHAHAERHLGRPHVGLGAMSAEEAINYGLSGPMLRACGVAYDVRKDFPYLDYETYDFDVPVGQNGDVYDRYLVRMEEMRQSIRILEQALDRLPDWARQRRRPARHPAAQVESDERHGGDDPSLQAGDGRSAPPVGEAYVAIESPKGEKGYYMVSDGTPSRCAGASVRRRS